MRDLLKKPLCWPEHLGAAIPDSVHATSACLPMWQDNVGYEEGEPRVVEALKAGYPRFVIHPVTQGLHDECATRFAATGEFCMAFPSPGAGERCLNFVAPDLRSVQHIHELDVNGVCAVILPDAYHERARHFWQHTGEGVSSRLAQATLEGRRGPAGNEAKVELRSRIADLSGETTDNVFLFATGMTAIFMAHRVLQRLTPGRRTVQFGFPYVDILKIQEKFGAGVHFYPKGDAVDLAALEELLSRDAIAGLYCEFPGNPTLRSPDLHRLAELAAKHRFPLVVDDTIATFVNVDLMPPADILASSLTKNFSGVGDVMGGSAVLNSKGPFYDDLAAGFAQEFEDNLYGEDAICLEGNSRDFCERVRRVNTTAESVCNFLVDHPSVAKVYYPRFQTREFYDAFRRRDGGYGGLFSLTFARPEDHAPRFFNTLEINKGPSLGTNFSLACPYTILAHYNELEFAEGNGVSRHLVRVSVGLEPADDLISRFEHALSVL